MYRAHPVEGIVFILRAAVVHGPCIGVFLFFLGDKVGLTTVLAASVFSFAFNAMGANLQHSSISLGFWKPVERPLISPAQHQIHHSTLDQDLEYGVRGQVSGRAHSHGALYIRPLRDAVNACYPQGNEFTPGSMAVAGIETTYLAQSKLKIAKPLPLCSYGSDQD